MMTKESYLLERYGQAVQFLPPRLRASAMGVPRALQMNAREFRLRVGEPLMLLDEAREIPVKTETNLRHEELATLVDIATGGSVHSAAESIRAGFLTVAGGHRVGLCGTGVQRGGEISFIRNISSAVIRIAKEFPGVSDGVYDELMQNGAFENTLIIAPPGCGKTTMLRDLIRNLSDRTPSYRVAVADERSEIAAKFLGVPQFSVGHHTDVMEGLPKSQAMMLMLRAMSPDILAVDEITVEEDIRAMECAANCGVALLATAHGNDVECLFARPLYRRLAELSIFRFAVVLGIANGTYTWKVLEL